MDSAESNHLAAMIRLGSAARALLLAPRQALVLSRRAFSDAAPDAAAAAAPEEAGEAASKSQRQKQAKADAKAKAADAKPAPPDFIGLLDFGPSGLL
jgi:hypothetical protein